MSDPLLEVEDLTIQYQTEKGALTAVSNASFSVKGGEYFGLVGESGSGKSTIGRAVIGGLDDNGQIESGSIRYRGEPIQDLSESEFNREVRWKEIAFIPQGSMNSLDPVRRIRDQALDIADAHGVDGEEALANFRDICEIMGIPEDRLSNYPHQFSGGMEQRAIIAFALFLEPSIVIADEPTTALDVIMQDQIFQYLEEFKTTLDSSMVLITHDISLVLEACEKMGVMHGGQVVETGTTKDLFDTPRHPYTVLLQRAFPDIRYPNRELEEIGGTPPQSMGEVNRCTFVDRCPLAVEKCRQQEPTLEPTPDLSTQNDHMVACFETDRVEPEMRSGTDAVSPAERGGHDDD